ncbi:MAG TPA: CpsD/CapB family tyrosine-protein kinase [Burkholderiaceae bacterium]|nr:CpsD/CapB family tyrosine-protein kinase [Burkholderiaceae bacterium]
MNDIERLFTGNRKVPGMRQGKVNRSKAATINRTVEDVDARPVAGTRADDAAAEASVHPEVVTDADSIAGHGVEGDHLVHAEGDFEHGAASGYVDPDVLAENDPLDAAFPVDAEVHIDARHPLADSRIERDAIDPTLPLLRPGPQLMLAHDAFNAHAENMRLLRTELLLRHSNQSEANAIAVLGACVGEGRSQLACELALSFAQFGRPTLLVDADFRHPRVHTLFGADLQQGLAQSIASGTAPQVRAVEGFPSLSIVMAGTCPPNPLELLTDGRFEHMVAGWRRKYEFVIVDTPPIADYADGLAIATAVGRVLVVTRAKHTTYGKAREMLSRLAATEAAIVGSVLNHF